MKKTTTSDNLEITPLFETTNDAATMDSTMMKFGMDPKSLRSRYKPGSSAVALAYKVSGTFKTAFPDGKPENNDESDTDTTGDNRTNEEHITESLKPCSKHKSLDVKNCPDCQKKHAASLKTIAALAKRLIKKYPDTSAAQKTKDLLDELGIGGK